MGKIDILSKEYMKSPERMADFLNGIVYGGSQKVSPSDLTEMDTAEILNLVAEEELNQVNGGQNRKRGTPNLMQFQELRDILSKCVLMKGEKAYYAIIGIENAGIVHYAEPVKNMLYDAINYYSQYKQYKRYHKELKDLDRSEYVSGISKQDKVYPVITFTIYWGIDEWDGPTKLTDMIELKDDALLRYLNDYDINLITPKKIKDFSQFKTDFGAVMEYIASSSDKDALKKLVSEKSSTYSNIDTTAAKLLGECTNISIDIESNKTEQVQLINVNKKLKKISDFFVLNRVQFSLGENILF